MLFAVIYADIRVPWDRPWPWELNLKYNKTVKTQKPINVILSFDKGFLYVFMLLCVVKLEYLGKF